MTEIEVRIAVWFPRNQFFGRFSTFPVGIRYA
jgi:hypothetical protein